jgi:hypothetical protein
MGRRMVVGVDDDPQSIDAQDRRHGDSLSKPKRSGKNYRLGAALDPFTKRLTTWW